MKAVVAAFNQEKALVGAFSVIVQLCRLIVDSSSSDDDDDDDDDDDECSGDDEEPPAHPLHSQAVRQGEGGAVHQPAHAAQVGDVHTAADGGAGTPAGHAPRGAQEAQQEVSTQ